VTSVLLRPAWMNTLMQNTHLHPSKRELWPLGKEVRGTVFGGPRSVDVSCILTAASLEVARKLVPGEEGGQKESSRREIWSDRRRDYGHTSRAIALRAGI
jgi:hypothetical protein